MKLDRRALLGTLGGVVLGMVNLAIAVAYAGGGHGTYTGAKLLFPYTMFLATAFAGSITAPLITLAILEFPLYGFAVGWAASRGRMKVVVYSILILHAVAWVLCLSVKTNDFAGLTGPTL